jgi:polyisoprenyl-phosphate glycosyltransferase
MEKMLILIPTYNDWQALGLLLNLIDDFLSCSSLRSDVLIVDDASTLPLDKKILLLRDFQSIDSLDALRLRRNLSHQKAIAIGLAYVEANLDQDLIIVMDADGEDNPCEIDKLLTQYYQEKQPKIIFARRSKRSENRTFRLFYQIYRMIYQLLTGKEISFGNFSLIPRPILHRLVVVSEIWIHYASGTMKSKLPLATVDVPRSRRLAGESKMNFTALVGHGLSSISVYGDVVGTRLLIATTGLIALLALLVAVVILIRLGTTLAIPGWATNVIGLLIILMIQSGLVSVVFSSIVLANRNTSTFIPSRDYSIFVLELIHIFHKL